MEVINELIKYPDVESETFDFKKKPSKLYEDICAMANTKGGFLVLGVGEIRSKDDKRILGFKKIGFKNGRQESIANQIGNDRFNIEPVPSVDIEHIPDDETKRFYTVIKIDSKITEKPYFLKTTDQCYARIQSSSRRVGRTTILNLFSSSVEQRKNIENLRSSTILLKEDLQNTLNYIVAISPNDQTRPAPIDPSFIKNAVLQAEWFLSENNLLGNHNTSEGFTTMLHVLDQMNVQINAYNTIPNSQYRSEIRFMIIEASSVLAMEIRRISPFLDRVIEATNNFLLKYK